MFVPLPEGATDPVALPELAGDTNEDLADFITRLKEAVKEANRRLEAIDGLQPAGPVTLPL